MDKRSAENNEIQQPVFIKEMPASEANEVKKPAKRSAHGRRRLFLVGLSFVLLAFFGFKNVKTMNLIHSLDHKQSQVEKELALEQEYQSELEDYIRLLEDEDYVLNLARNEYYLTQDDEVVFNFVDEEGSKESDLNEKSKELEKKKNDLDQVGEADTAN